MPAKESQKEDWKAQRAQVAKAKDLPPVDPAIVNKKPLSVYEQQMAESFRKYPPKPGVEKPSWGTGRVILSRGTPSPETDPGWMDQQSAPLDYLLRLMAAAQKDTKTTRSHRPLSGKRGKRIEKEKSYRERLHGLFGSEKP